MLNKLRVESIQAELASIERLLKESDEAGDPVSRIQFQYKKDKLQEELSTLEIGGPKASVALFFSGRPVIGSRAIRADFTAEILKEFQDIVSKVHANLAFGKMGTRGKVPLSASSGLVISSVVKGSFGFVLEEMTDQGQAIDTTLKFVVGEAIELIVNIGTQDEERYLEIFRKIDGRTLISIKDFFTNLDGGNAQIRIVDDKNDYILDANYIRRAKIRADSISVSDEPKELVCRVVGILPNHRKIEVELEDRTPVYGSINDEALDQYTSLIAEGNKILNEVWTMVFLVRTVRPHNHKEKVFYTLTGFISKN